mmetsp:Transcript_3188/g.4945  ORF Transcript_3188/g.4945 Transcript_3188/m.4945 type:complete len:160 (-) Transcript_3188:220-699(-)
MSDNEQKWDHLYTVKEFHDPVVLGAEVVHGFKRGSKELGIPTANLAMEELGDHGESLDTGIYYGWAKLRESYYEAVVSVGWNPFYNNTKKTVEAHLLESLDDFYGEHLDIALCGYLREECNFTSLDDLISCIQSDISRSKGYLSKTASIYSQPSFWKST